MIRLQENTPEIYTKGSRDFQTICRIYDLGNNAVRYNVKSSRTILDPEQANDRILSLLATRVGFFPKAEYNVKALRYIIESFPYILKYKGSKRGIEYALNAIIRSEQHYKNSKIIVNNENSTITIYVDSPIENEMLFRDVLDYVLPVGYDVLISYYVLSSDNTTQLGLSDTSDSDIFNSADLSIIVDGGSQGNTIEDNATGSYTTTEIQ